MPISGKGPIMVPNQMIPGQSAPLAGIPNKLNSTLGPQGLQQRR